MKRFLDKTWAKLMAFFLTLVFGVMTILGGVGIGVLASADVFLDGGAHMRQSLYESQCMSAIYSAHDYLYGTLANADQLASDTPAADTADTTSSGSADITEEEQQVLDDLPGSFAQEFPRETSACHLALVNKATGAITFENFPLTDSDKPLYTSQETFTYTFSDGHKEEFTISADLLRSDELPNYSHLLLSWLLGHTELVIFLTVLFLLLMLFCFGFSMTSAGHWAGHEGIHLTWLDKIPADVWLLALLCAFFIGWETFYYGWGRLWSCAALVPFILLFLCVFAAQCKAGTVLRRSLTARILRLLWRIVRALFLWLWRIVRNLPLLWKTALVMVGVSFLEMILVLAGYGSVDGIFVMMKAVELLAALCIALNLRTLQKGGEKLAQGDFSSPIDTRYLIGDFKRFGQELNDVQGGMERAVQEQMKAEHLKTELITNVSHDIKTPLTSIVNYVDLLQKVDVQPETAREYIAVLDRQSRRLKKLTEDLVEASKASSGALPVELQPTDVAVLFDQIVGEYQERLAACRLTLVARPPEKPVSVRADGKLLSRVMDNLVSNVCKYAMEDTRVYVVASSDVETVTISFKNVSRAELNISPDELMERFVRGDASRHTEGSGLGLSIAGSLVHLMGGTFGLSIDGDLFRADITLPRA